jgi:hypothetical protein
MKGKTDRFGKFFLYVGVEIILEFLTLDLKESVLLSQVYEAETNKNSTSIQLERQYKHVQVQQRRIEMLKERKNLN